MGLSSVGVPSDGPCDWAAVFGEVEEGSKPVSSIGVGTGRRGGRSRLRRRRSGRVAQVRREACKLLLESFTRNAAEGGVAGLGGGVDGGGVGGGFGGGGIEGISR